MKDERLFESAKNNIESAENAMIEKLKMKLEENQNYIVQLKELNVHQDKALKAATQFIRNWKINIVGSNPDLKSIWTN